MGIFATIAAYVVSNDARGTARVFVTRHIGDVELETITQRYRAIGWTLRACPIATGQTVTDLLEELELEAATAFARDV